MQTNIDLIPVEERVKRSREQAKKLGLITSVILLLISAIASGVVYYYNSKLDEQTQEVNKSIEAKKRKISDKADIEVSVRNLDAKYKLLKDYLSSRLYYSKLLVELSNRVPTTVTINTVDSSSPSKANLTGVATDYISLAKFLNSLANPDLSSASANTKDKNLFKEVAINTVTLDPLNAAARFNLNLTIDTDLLKEK